MTYYQTILVAGQIYHVFNRGVEKRTTFIDSKDYERFVDTLNYYRVKTPPARFSFRKRGIFSGRQAETVSIGEIICFCLMPNHFHLLVKQIEEQGITTLLSKLTNSYTKYFNTKHKRVGPLFQGSFKAVRIENDEQLIHATRYIHLNPLMDYLVKDLKLYPYSSYLEFLGEKSGFCQIKDILAHFKNPGEYERFVLDQEDYARSLKQMERTLLDK